MKFTPSLLLVSCAVHLWACGVPTETQDSETTAQSALVSGTRVERSLAITNVNNPAAWSAIAPKFSFKRTMDQVISTGGVTPLPTDTAVWQSWMHTFDKGAPNGCDSSNVDPNKFGFTCPRTDEAQLDTKDPFAATPTVTFTPVALFNRFDLAPSNGANCGEYRIIYAMTGGVSGRAFIIFEAALPNPSPTLGLNGCQPVAQFWQGLSNENDPAALASKLEAFYYLGTAVPNVVPAVAAANYGLSTNQAAPGAGQIRTDFFVNFHQWHLREFKPKRTCAAGACTFAMQEVTVKANPANELFSGTSALAPQFETEFLAKLGSLRGPVTNINLRVSDTFNEWESISQPFTAPADVQYSQWATASFKADVQARLTALGSPLTPDNVLDRATTQTCAGCHQLSNGKDLGQRITWPSSLNFVHVDEQGNLSQALTGVFLPKRLQVLEAFINNAPAAQVADQTVGGSAIGAPN